MGMGRGGDEQALWSLMFAIEETERRVKRCWEIVWGFRIWMSNIKGFEYVESNLSTSLSLSLTGKDEIYIP